MRCVLVVASLLLLGVLAIPARAGGARLFLLDDEEPADRGRREFLVEPRERGIERAWAGGVISRPSRPDLAGLSRDFQYLLVFQTLSLGWLYVAPENFSNWTEEEKEDIGVGRYVFNMTHPTLDPDAAYLNYGIHPYFGSAYFLSARDRGASRWQSFLYSTLASTVYEFAIEVVAEPVSIQDLFVTPIGGTLLGMLVEPVLDEIRTHPRPGVARSLLAGFLDPFGEANRTIDGWRGFSTRSVVEVRPLGRRGYSGIELTHRW